MKTSKPHHPSLPLSLIALLFLATSVQAAPTQLASSPLSSASSVAVQPNVLFVLDDSGSMNQPCLPDWACSAPTPRPYSIDLYMSRNAAFNGVTYNPAVTYTPPKYFDVAGNLDTTTYPAQVSPWTAVKDDGYSGSATTSNLTNRAYYFTTQAGEYCSNESMKSCIAASAPSVGFPVAARLRWCTTAAEAAATTPTPGACQATQIEPSPPPPATATNASFNFPRMPGPRTSTLTISGTISGTISSITVNSQNILSAAIVTSGTAATLASAIETSINACSFVVTGICGVAGYSAVASGNTVTISAPAAITFTPVITQTASVSFAPTAFARPSSNLAPGENLRTVIIPTVTTYPKASTRNDCAGATTCTYAEEMNNYANWWAYYRTRMLTMKTAASLSFENISGNFRVGYMSINNNTGTDFQNLDSFTTAQKKAWYDKLFAAQPNNDTPLRVALSNAGRLYAGKLSTLNGISVVDPVQHYCQKNVTLLSTDGYWNQGAGFQVDGTTAVGDQDGPGLEVRPQLDAGSPLYAMSTTQETQTQTFASYQQPQYQTAQTQSSTSQLQQRTLTQPQSQTSQLQSKTAQAQFQTTQLQQRTLTQLQISTLTQLQSQTSQLQSKTAQLQSRTSQLQRSTLTQLQSQTSQLQSKTAQPQSQTSQLQQNLTPVQQRTSSDFGTTWTGWTNVASCSTTQPRFANLANLTQCRTQPQTGWTNVSSCTVASGSTVTSNAGTDREVTTYTADSQCQSTPPTAWANVASCTPGTNASGLTTSCQTTFTGQPWVNAASCTPSATVQCQSTTPTAWANVASCTPGTNASGLTTSCQTVWTTPANAATCTPSATVQCSNTTPTAWANAASCTAGTNASGLTTSCQNTFTGQPWVNAASCTASATVQCRSTTPTTWANVASCTPGTNASGLTTSCQTVWTTPVNTATCTPNATTQCTTTWTNWANAASCTGSATVQCQSTTPTAWTNVASCTPGTNATGLTTSCQNIFTGQPWVNAASCTPSATVQCQSTTPTPWANVASCTPGTNASGLTTSCQNTWTNWANAASCTPSATVQCQSTTPTAWANASSCTAGTNASGLTTSCQTVPVVGTWTNTATPTTACVPGTSGSGLVTTCNPNPPTVTPPPTGPTPVQAGSCQAGVVGAVTTACNTVTLSGPTNVTSCAPITGGAPSYINTLCAPGGSTGQTPDTLADVAQYYWKTDLRDPALSNCTGGPVVIGGVTVNNNVCTNDTQYPRQYMNTYTLGLGASGLMQFQANYLTATSGDYWSVWQGQTADPLLGICPWQSFSACNWPQPASNSQTNIDDLWHAAVNGRGTYFSASDPSSLAAGISGALSAVTVRSGALASASVTSGNLVAGSNGVFEVSFTVGEWSGDVVKRTINGTTGALSPLPVPPATHTLPGWSAQAKLDARVSARTIYTYDPGGTNNLKPFLYANLTPTQQGYFALSAIALPPAGSGTLSQFCASGTICLSAGTQTAASGAPLVNFLRGDRSNEGPLSNLGAYFRQRTHLLGDIVGSEAIYVQGSPWNYADYNYAGFKSGNSSRAGMVYVAANDGMLHAFDESTGDEAWAYVPAIVMDTLYKLADKNYGGQGGHRFNVDGTPVYGDICASGCPTPSSGSNASVWKTILVGGLNAGGRGYYALDITNPLVPKALWEFTDTDLGYSYGNPVITKLKDGRWVVIISSGYNNIGPGDGIGHLYILEADTGVLIRRIDTGVGSTTTPSGLGRIAAWANFPDNNNMAQRVYGGDLLGNLWRFDVNGDLPAPAVPPALPVYDAQRLASLVDASGTAQPITSKPELGKVGNYAVVYVGTGQLLGPNDLSSNQQQSLYAIKDRLTLATPDYGSPRTLSPAQTSPTPGVFVVQTLTAATCPTGSSFCTSGAAVFTSSGNPVDFNTDDGWYLDFPVTGERVNTDLRLQLGTLAFNTNTPTLGACVPVGSSNAYFVDYQTGGYVSGTSGLSGVHLGSFLATAPSIIRLQDGTIRALVRTDAPDTIVQPVPAAPSLLDTRRVSWRELVSE